jgi:hypothetical protein
MTDPAPDTKQPRHGALWYVGCGLFLYVLSFISVVVAVYWIDRRWGHLPPEVAAVLNLMYWPIIQLLNSSPVKYLILQIASLFASP